MILAKTSDLVRYTELRARAWAELESNNGEMKSLDILRRQAFSSANFRGHVLQWQAPHHGEARSYQIGECPFCHMQVCVNTRPAPNEIDIGGEAIALNCPNGIKS